MNRLNPSDSLSFCPKCRRKLPSGGPPFGRQESLRGNEHVKRGLEVAFTGQHSVVLVAHRNTLEDAGHFATYGVDNGVDAYVLTPCPCGNSGDPREECRCTATQVKRWVSKSSFKLARQNGQVFLELSYVTANNLLSQRRPENDEDIWRRISAGRLKLAATVYPDLRQNPTSTSLLRAAIQQLRLTQGEVSRIESVSRTIAALAGADEIQPAHLAEAIQYRRRVGD